MYKLEKYKHKLMQVNGGGGWLVSKVTNPYLNDQEQKNVYKREYLRLKNGGGGGLTEAEFKVYSQICTKYEKIKEEYKTIFDQMVTEYELNKSEENRLRLETALKKYTDIIDIQKQLIESQKKLIESCKKNIKADITEAENADRSVKKKFYEMIQKFEQIALILTLTLTRGGLTEEEIKVYFQICKKYEKIEEEYKTIFDQRVTEYELNKSEDNRLRLETALKKYTDIIDFQKKLIESYQKIIKADITEAEHADKSAKEKFYEMIQKFEQIALNLKADAFGTGKKMSD